MTRIPVPSVEQASSESQAILAGVGSTLGFVPNVTRLLSLSPIALEAFVGLQKTLSKALDARTRNGLALAVSNANGCNYCIAIHSFVAGKLAREEPEEVALNLEGTSRHPRKAAAAQFGKRLIETRGAVSDADLAEVRAAGFSDAEVVELVALTAQVLMTNFLNNVAETQIDVPAAGPVAA
jgi:uncharacterized peroxidase-related enzyme